MNGEVTGWVDYVVTVGVDDYMYMTHFLCTDNDMYNEYPTTSPLRAAYTL